MGVWLNELNEYIEILPDWQALLYPRVNKRERHNHPRRISHIFTPCVTAM